MGTVVTKGNAPVECFCRRVELNDSALQNKEGLVCIVRFVKIHDLFSC